MSASHCQLPYETLWFRYALPNAKEYMEAYLTALTKDNNALDLAIWYAKYYRLVRLAEPNAVSNDDICSCNSYSYLVLLIIPT